MTQTLKPQAVVAPGILIIEAGAQQLRRHGHTKALERFWTATESAREAGTLRMFRYKTARSPPPEPAPGDRPTAS